MAEAAGGEPTVLVANLPYNVAATIILDFFERMPALERAVVMVQKEVADRIAATLGIAPDSEFRLQAALKYRRALYVTNPTPVTREQAHNNLEEEVTDVLTCLASVMQPEGMAGFWIEWNMVVGKKAARWRQRLEERGRDGDGEKPVV